MLLVNTPQKSFELEEDIYALNIKTAKRGTKNDKPTVEFSYEILDGKRAGQEVRFQTFFLTEDAVWKFFQLVSAITGKTYGPEETFAFPVGEEQNMVGQEFCAKMGTRSYKKKDGSTGTVNEPMAIDYVFFHNIEAYQTLKAAWDMEHGEATGFDDDPLGDIDDHPF